jgi:c-di-GMP-binding flagellar brake protein YcgR
MQHIRRPERRRTMRVSLQIPLKVQCQLSPEETLTYRASTQKVCADGALLLLDALVVPGQPLQLTNEATRETVKCFVTSVRERRDRKNNFQRFVGVGFALPQTNFWHIAFPKAGTRQAVRSLRTGDLVYSSEIGPYRRFGT